MMLDSTGCFMLAKATSTHPLNQVLMISCFLAGAKIILLFSLFSVLSISMHSGARSLMICEKESLREPAGVQ